MFGCTSFHHAEASCTHGCACVYGCPRKQQDRKPPNHSLSTAFNKAVQEALSALEHGSYTVCPYILPEPVPNGMAQLGCCPGCYASLGRGESLCAGCLRLVDANQCCPVCEIPWHPGAAFRGVECDRCSMWVHEACDSRASHVMATLAEDPEHEVSYVCRQCKRSSWKQNKYTTSQRRGSEKGKRDCSSASLDKESANAAIQELATDELDLVALRRLWSANDELPARHRLLDSDGGIQKPRSAWNIFSLRFDKCLNEVGLEAPTHATERWKVDEWRNASSHAKLPFEQFAREEQREYGRLIMETECDSESKSAKNDVPYRSRLSQRSRQQRAVQSLNGPSEAKTQTSALRAHQGIKRKAVEVEELPLEEIGMDEEELPYQCSGMYRGDKFGRDHSLHSMHFRISRRKQASRDDVNVRDANHHNTGENASHDGASADLLKSIDLVQKQSTHLEGKQHAVTCYDKHGVYWPAYDAVECKCETCNCRDSSSLHDVASFVEHAGVTSCTKPAQYISIDNKDSSGERSKSLSQLLGNLGNHTVGNFACESELPGEKCSQEDKTKKNHNQGHKTSCATSWRGTRRTGGRNVQQSMDVEVRWQIDRCSVCDSDIDDASNQLIMCSDCKVVVHQHCYGVHVAPDDVSWICRACEYKQIQGWRPRCRMCPVIGGALKPMDDGDSWCHLTCYQWLPGLELKDLETLEPISGLNKIDPDRWTLLCTVCRQRTGVKLQCDSKGCCIAYHPLCARAAGFFMRIIDEGPEKPVRHLSYCHLHQEISRQRALRYGGHLGPMARATKHDEKRHGNKKNWQHGRVRTKQNLNRSESNSEDEMESDEGSGKDQGVETHSTTAMPEKAKLCADPDLTFNRSNRKHGTIEECTRCRRHRRLGHPPTEAAIGSTRVRRELGINSADGIHSDTVERVEDNEWRQTSVRTTLDFNNRHSAQHNEQVEQHADMQHADVSAQYMPEKMHWNTQAFASKQIFENDPTAASRPDISIEVRCGKVQGILHVNMWRIECTCAYCKQLPEIRRLFPIQQFRAHALKEHNEHEIDDKNIETNQECYSLPVGTPINTLVESLQLLLPPARVLHGDVIPYNSLPKHVMEELQRAVPQLQQFMKVKARDSNNSLGSQSSTFHTGHSKPSGSASLAQKHILQQLGYFGSTYSAADSIENDNILMQARLAAARSLIGRRLRVHESHSRGGVISGCSIRDDGELLFSVRYSDAEHETIALAEQKSLKWTDDLPAPHMNFNPPLALSIRPPLSDEACVSAVAVCNGSFGRLWPCPNGCIIDCYCTECRFQQHRQPVPANEWSLHCGDVSRQWRDSIRIVLADASGTCDLGSWIGEAGAGGTAAGTPEERKKVSREKKGETVLERKMEYVEALPYICAPTIASASEESFPTGRSLRPDEWRKKRAGELEEGRTMREKIDNVRNNEGELVTFGKSGIHGWGLFARTAIAVGDPVTEFRGEVLTAAAADVREKEYEEQQQDCYMLHADQDAVIDATNAGCAGRFINHSCAPNLFVKMVGAESEPCSRIVFFAREHIYPFMELTFAYRMSSSSDAPCLCGSAGCQGRLGGAPR